MSRGQGVRSVSRRLTLGYSLVDPGVVLSLAREAKHAADDSAVLLAPCRVADLLPLAAVLHLHVALRHRDALTVGREDGPNPDVLHLDVQILGRKQHKCLIKHFVYSWQRQTDDSGVHYRTLKTRGGIIKTSEQRGGKTMTIASLLASS